MRLHTQLKKSWPHSQSDVIAYALVATIISLAIYYLPDYTPLEISIANHSSWLLHALGFESRIHMFDSSVLVDGFVIERDCTGIQVLAVFAGLVLPVPSITGRRKLILLSSVALATYALNVARIVLQIRLYYGNLLSWGSVHDFFGRLLAIFSVFVLVLVTAKAFPEFKQFLMRTVAIVRESVAVSASSLKKRQSGCAHCESA
jgi:exosortase/archaeosortase family protein